MIFLLMELYDCLMAYIMFQEQYGNKFFVEKQDKHCQRASKGTRNVDFCRY